MPQSPQQKGVQKRPGINYVVILLYMPHLMHLTYTDSHTSDSMLAAIDDSALGKWVNPNI